MVKENKNAKRKEKILSAVLGFATGMLTAPYVREFIHWLFSFLK